MSPSLRPSASRPLRWAGVALLALWAVSIVRDPDAWRFIDGVNLLLHEAGHPLFGFFGEFLTVLGGTLVQLLFPLAFAAYFHRSEQPFAAAVSLAWAGENLFNVARYAADARARALPLVGGDDAGHDWAYLLARTGLLESDQAVAQSLRIAGSLLLLGAVLRAIQVALSPVPERAPAPGPLRAEEEALARYLADGSR